LVASVPIRKEALLSSQIEGTPVAAARPVPASSIGQLERIGILRELTGRPRNKIFAYDECLKILSEETEPL
jgi:hypothetical protein